MFREYFGAGRRCKKLLLVQRLIDFHVIFPCAPFGYVWSSIELIYVSYICLRWLIPKTLVHFLYHFHRNTFKFVGHLGKSIRFNPVNHTRWMYQYKIITEIDIINIYRLKKIQTLAANIKNISINAYSVN